MLKISCSKAQCSAKHLAVYVPQPVARATWRKIIRTCVFQWRKPYAHLKETTTLSSVKESIPLSLLQTSHYRIIILWAEMKWSKILKHCIAGFSSGRNVRTSFPWRKPNKNARSLTLNLKRIHNLFHAETYTVAREVIWYTVCPNSWLRIRVYWPSSWIQITDHSLYLCIIEEKQEACGEVLASCCRQDLQTNYPPAEKPGPGHTHKSLSTSMFMLTNYKQWLIKLYEQIP